MHFIGPYASVITIVTMKKDDTQLTVCLPAPPSKNMALGWVKLPSRTDEPSGEITQPNVLLSYRPCIHKSAFKKSPRNNFL